jgi:hypothetical protein
VRILTAYKSEIIRSPATTGGLSQRGQVGSATEIHAVFEDDDGKVAPMTLCDFSYPLSWLRRDELWNPDAIVARRGCRERTPKPA